VARPLFAAAWFVMVVVLAILWVLPEVLFPRPGTNDAILLSDLEWPLLLVELVGMAVAFVVTRRAHATVVRVALSVFLLGVALDLVIGLVTFGNLSNDRFAALLFLSVPVGFAGVVGLIVSLAIGSSRRLEIARGAVYGVAAAVVFGVWTMVRGAQDWLLAPYGFDILLLILVLGLALAVLPIGTRVKSPEAPG
jgi:hypothetical protein